MGFFSALKKIGKVAVKVSTAPVRLQAKYAGKILTAASKVGTTPGRRPAPVARPALTVSSFAPRNPALTAAAGAYEANNPGTKLYDAGGGVVRDSGTGQVVNLSPAAAPLATSQWAAPAAQAAPSYAPAAPSYAPAPLAPMVSQGGGGGGGGGGWGGSASVEPFDAGGYGADDGDAYGGGSDDGGYGGGGGDDQEEGFGDIDYLEHFGDLGDWKDTLATLGKAAGAGGLTMGGALLAASLAKGGGATDIAKAAAAAKAAADAKKAAGMPIWVKVAIGGAVALPVLFLVTRHRAAVAPNPRRKRGRLEGRYTKAALTKAGWKQWPVPRRGSIPASARAEYKALEALTARFPGTFPKKKKTTRKRR